MKMKTIFASKAFFIAILSGLFMASTASAQFPAREISTTIVEVGEQAIEVDITFPEEVYDAYLYWHRADELFLDSVNYSILADTEGKVVHRWDTDLTGGGNTSYLLDSGGILRIGIRDESGGGPIAYADTLQITDRAGKAIWQLNAEDLDIDGNRILFHHDMQMQPNGNIYVLIFEELSSEEAAAAGWTPENVTEIWSDGLMEIKPNLDDGSHEVVWQWRFIDHIIQDKDPEAPNYGVVADNPRRIDAHYPPNYNPSIGAQAARQHLNSVDYNADLDQILLSAWFYDEIWIIDRGITAEEASGRAGDLLFRYGNPAAHDMGTVEDRLLARQHDAQWVKDGYPGAGNILVFNNNNRNSFSRNILGNPNNSDRSGGPDRGGRDAGRAAPQGGGMGVSSAEVAMTGVSNVHELLPVIGKDGEYVIGEDGMYEVQQVWFWEEEGFFATTQGSAKRLPNGNTLLSNTGKQFVIEVTPEGKTVARYQGTAPAFKSFKYTKEQLGDLID